ncbi:MAG TPA: hypothetical protein VGF95_14850 [Solirubrobacteraceae bacterium]
MKPTRILIAGALAALACSPASLAEAKPKPKHKASQHAKSKKAKGPFVKVVGLSVDEQDYNPGTHITEKAPLNACYYIFGEAASPSSMIFVALLEASGIPEGAKTSIDVVAPWTTQGFGEGVQESEVPFSEAIFSDKKESAGVVAGGGTSKDDYFRWVQLQGGSIEAGDGRYSVSISVEVGKQTLEAHGSITVGC